MSEPTIIYQSSETQYWYDEGGSMLCQYKPELWREGYSSETFGVSMNETELVTALTLATQRAEAAEAERDALRKQAEAAEAERDVLAEKWGDMVDDHGDPLDVSGILEYVCTLREELSHMKAERDKLRTVYKAAAVYCGDRTVANAHALIDAVGEIRALAVQP